jgi:hypothetical protein
MLPLNLQMEIDISAAAHKREIAAGFARLRERLLPPEEPSPLASLMNALGNNYVVSPEMARRMAAQQNVNPYGVNQLMAANADWGQAALVGASSGWFDVPVSLTSN